MVKKTETEASKSQAWLHLGVGGRIRLGGPTEPTRARETAQRVRQNRPVGSSDWVEVHETGRPEEYRRPRP